MAASMEDRVAAASPFLLGERMSIADILLTTTLNWAHNYELKLSDACHSYRERLCAREAYARALQVNTPAKA